jgi:hypothetical protein
MKRPARRGTLASLLAAMALLACAPLTQAAYDPLGAGSTRLSFDKAFLALLKQNGVKLSVVGPAELKAGTVSFPVSGGKFDPTTAEGTVEHEGALLFKAGAKSVPLKALQLKTTQRRSPFSVKAGGSQLKLATAKSLTVARQGFGDKVKIRSLSLSAKLATRLGKKLRLRGVFAEGQTLGSALSRVQPQTVTVLGKGKAELVLDPGFAAKLGSLFLAANPIFPAERPGVFTLPIFGGKIAPDGSQGTIETSGALELLQQGGGQVFWAESWLDLAARTVSPEVDIQPSPPYGGKVGRVALADLGVGAISANPTARTVTVQGIALALQAQTAATFNDVFARPQGKDGVFAAGEALGTISFVAQGQ